MARFILGYDRTIRSYMSSLEKRLAEAQARS
jgi:hypothetical protein